MIAQRQEIQGVRGHGFIRIDLDNLFESMSGCEIRLSAVVELPDKEMHLSEPFMALLDLLLRLGIVTTAGKILAHALECRDGFGQRFRVPIDGLGHFEMGLAYLKSGVGGEYMTFMQVEKVVIFDERFGIFLLVEEGFAALHDDVRVIVLFDGVAEEDLLVGAADSLGPRRNGRLFGRTRASGGEPCDEQKAARQNAGLMTEVVQKA